MYTKKELRELPIPTLPKDRTEAIYDTSTEFILRSMLAYNGKLLVVAFYSRQSAVNGFPLPTAVLYMSRDEYITRLYGTEKDIWSTAKTDHALGYGNRAMSAICLRKSDKKRILSFIRKKDTVDGSRIASLLVGYQNDILSQRVIARKIALAESVDKRMEDIPKVPTAFHKWLLNTPLRHSRYVIYRRKSKKAADGYCTHCRSLVTFQEELPRHNQKGRCPHCRTAVTFKAEGRQRRLRDTGHAVLMQKTRDGQYVLRYFEVYAGYKPEEFVPLVWERQTRSEELARLVLDSEGRITGKYKNRYSGKTDRVGWNPVTDNITGDNIRWEINCGFYISIMNDWFEDAWLYPYNVKGILTELKLSYEVKGMLFDKAQNITTPLLQSVRYPFVHSLEKLGYGKLSAELLIKGKDLDAPKRFGPLHQCLGVPKPFMKVLRKNDVGVYELSVLACLDSPAEADYQWIKKQNLRADKLKYILSYTSFRKAKNYLMRQRRAAKKENRQYFASISRLLIFWADYLQMAGHLKFKVSEGKVLFPKDIKDEHDKVMMLVKVRKNHAMDLRIQQLYPSMNEKYYFESGELLIRPPCDFQEFIDEGRLLMHCVCTNGYYKGHVAGTRPIFFIRRKTDPETPFYTVEYDPCNRIMQCQGHRHKEATPAVTEFTDSWLQYLTGATVLAA